MSTWQEIKLLLRKELLEEWRARYTLAGFLLYALATVFLIGLFYRRSISPQSWNALYWVAMLFVGVTAVAKSFLAESPGRRLYLYQLARPEAIILAKMLYNAGLMLLLSLATLAAHSFFLGWPVLQPGWLLLGVALAATGLGCTLTFVSAVASGGGNRSTLLAVLGMPLLVPLLLGAYRLTQGAILNTARPQDALFLAGAAGLSGALAWLLFPVLWRE